MKKRNINLDLIRVIATFSVLSVHFFLNNGFYSEIVIGKRMYIATLMRSAFMVCVPLFIILTGYLMNQKTLSVKYLTNIKKVLSIYVLSMLAIIIYRIIRYNEGATLKDVIFNITNFKFYAWYIEMYIGLYLLIPFINLAYHNLKSKKDKKLGCIVLLFLTAAPSFFNSIFDFALIPDWWVGIYPISYYIIGAYIAEYKDEIKLSLKVNFIFIIISFVLAGTYSYMRSYNTTFVWGTWNNWFGFTNVLSSVFVFLFLVRLNIDNCPNIIKKIIGFLSTISLPTYLLSHIADDICYSKLNSIIVNPLDRLFYYIPTVPIVFIASTCFAIIIYLLNKILSRICSKIFKADIPN